LFRNVDLFGAIFSHQTLQFPAFLIERGIYGAPDVVFANSTSCSALRRNHLRRPPKSTPMQNSKNPERHKPFESFVHDPRFKIALLRSGFGATDVWCAGLKAPHPARPKVSECPEQRSHLTWLQHCDYFDF
jgi:hypothetical protein